MSPTTGSNFMPFFAHSSCNIITSFLFPKSYLSANLLVALADSSPASSSTHYTHDLSTIHWECVLIGSTVFSFKINHIYIIFAKNKCKFNNNSHLLTKLCGKFINFLILYDIMGVLCVLTNRINSLE